MATAEHDSYSIRSRSEPLANRRRGFLRFVTDSVLLGRYHFTRRAVDGTHRFRLKDRRRSNEVAAMVWLDFDTGGFTLGALAVMAEYRRRGIATALLEALCSGADLSQVELWVHVLPFDVDGDGKMHIGYPTKDAPLSKKALEKFYASFGFSGSKKHHGFLVREPIAFPEVVMTDGLT